MNKIALLIETKDHAAKSAVYGMIAAARGNGRDISAFVIEENPEAYRQNLQEYGIETIISIKVNGSGGAYHPYHWAQSIVAAMERFDITTLLGLTTPRGKTLLPLIAAKLEAPLAMDCRAVDLENNIAEKVLYSGKVNAQLRLKGSHFIYGMGYSFIDPVPFPVQSKVVSFEYKVEETSGYRIIGKRTETHEGVDLSEADVIVSGGRGVGGKENFITLHECAEALNGSVGASRAAVDSGWVPYSMQVGQTGAKVGPKVYIACGLSGSLQHLAGMKNSGLVIAVNIDANAPIASHCDYFVNEDLFTILPLLTQKVKKARSADTKTSKKRS